MTSSTGGADSKSARRVRGQYACWLWASVPVALIIDVGLTGLAGFTWCGFNTCHYSSTSAELRISVMTTIPLLFGVFLVTFLAVVLPPWIPGWKRPTIATAVGLMALTAASVKRLFAITRNILVRGVR